MSTVLEQVKARSVALTPDGVRREIVAVTERRRQLLQEERSLLGVEHGARPALKTAVREADVQLEALRESLPFAGKYKRLDLEPLRWRDQQGLPKLVLFRTEQPSFQLSAGTRPTRRDGEEGLVVFGGLLILAAVLAIIGIVGAAVVGGTYELFGSDVPVRVWMHRWMAYLGLPIPAALATYFLARGLWELVLWIRRRPPLPKKLWDCYADVRKTLQHRCTEQGLSSITTRAEFSGLVPQHIREKIRLARKEFRDVLLLAEPKKWSFKEVAQPLPKGDPLVLGWDGAHLWFIDAFDTTPVEEYARREFVS